jgi:opacity protein-like surface antigen
MHNLMFFAQIDGYSQSSPRTMMSKISRSISIAIAISSLLTIYCQRSDAKERLEPLSWSSSGISIAQNPNTPTPEQLDRQRDAERVLKQGETLKREIRDNGSDPGNTQRQVDDQLNKVRESESDPQKVRAAEAELTRIRQQNNRYYYDPYYSAPGQIIFSPWYGTTPPATTEDRQDNGGSSRRDAQTASSTQVFGTAGFTGGGIAPSIGVRYNSFGLEIGALFNQDNLGAVNDFSLPNNFFFTNLGVKKLSPQWGVDLLGFVDVSPRVSAYGSVGVYFQNVGQIAQSQATNELYKQTNSINTTGAIGGGVTYSLSDSLSIGLGYHSVRGVNVRLGVNF